MTRCGRSWGRRRPIRRGVRGGIEPEFLAEGTAVRDFAQPHRVIVGVVSQEAQEFMEALYAPFTKRKPGLLQFTDPKSAIVTKLAANSFLACRVALMNELARYCDAVGPTSIRAHRTCQRSADRPLFLTRGRATVEAASERIFGHCAKARGNTDGCEPDPGDRGIEQPAQALPAEENRTVFRVDARKRRSRFGAWRSRPGQTISGNRRRWMRSSTARARGAHPGSRPQALRRAEDRFGNRIKQFENKYAAVCGAHALVIMTEWDAYKSPDYHELGERLTDRVIFDARNILDANEVRQAGLVYVGIGLRCADREMVGEPLIGSMMVLCAWASTLLSPNLWKRPPSRPRISARTRSRSSPPAPACGVPRYQLPGWTSLRLGGARA